MSIFNKFPSYDYIIKNAGSSLQRFPATILSALVATICLIWMAEFDIEPGIDLPSKIVLLAMLGLPLSTGLALFAEKKKWTRSKSLVLQSLGLIFLVGYFFTLPEQILKADYHFIRIFLFNLAFHFLVAFLPYLTSDDENGFWQYNKTLFLRFLTSALFSAVLLLGLSLALAAIDHLFGVDIKIERHLQLWAIIGVFVNSFIFLSGIPDDLNKLSLDQSYPKGLKVFAQYILLPLVTVYFAILIIYESKIIITWDWPTGWVAQLVLWYSVIGILSLLLLYPLRKINENRWIQTYSKQFFYALIPLLFMLYFAILKRIDEYGFTENRYYVLAMAIGLTFVVIYFIFSRKKEIKIIPVTICILALIAAIGPFSSFAIAQKAQTERLVSFFNKHEMLENDILTQPISTIPFEDRKEMSSIIGHMENMYGLEPFIKWLPDTAIQKLDTSAYPNAYDITKYLHFTYVDYWETEETGERFRYEAVYKNLMQTIDRRYFLDFEFYGTKQDSTEYSETYKFITDTFLVSYNDKLNIITIFRHLDEDTSINKIEFDIDKIMKKHFECIECIKVPAYKLLGLSSNKYFTVDFQIRDIEGYIRHDSVFYERMRAYILIK